MARRSADPFFPIMAWGCHGTDLRTPAKPALLRKMREAGLTVAGFVEPKGLSACAAAGLRAIVIDPVLSHHDWRTVDAKAVARRISALIARTRRQRAVFGYYLKDEPCAEEFAGLARVAAIVAKHHPGVWPYINLLPNYANAQQLGAPDYDSYLARFVAECRPPVMSYDHYALFANGRPLREGYFANLASVRAAALTADAPFWNIVLSTAHFEYAEATAADLRFQAWTSLAYGARGLAWFTYFTPAVGNYRLGAIDQFGHETPTYAMMRDVNLQVLQVAPTYLRLRSDRVYHFGGSPDGQPGPDGESLIDAANGQITVGDFTHEDGSRYAVIVNRDRTAAVWPSLRTRVRGARIDLVSPYGLGHVAWAGEQVVLAAGQGALLRIGSDRAVKPDHGLGEIR